MCIVTFFGFSRCLRKSPLRFRRNVPLMFPEELRAQLGTPEPEAGALAWDAASEVMEYLVKYGH